MRIIVNWNLYETLEALLATSAKTTFELYVKSLMAIILADETGTETRWQLSVVMLSYDKVFRDALEKIDVLRGQDHSMGRNLKCLPPPKKPIQVAGTSSKAQIADAIQTVLSVSGWQKVCSVRTG